MSNTRHVELFTAGCPVCDASVDLVREIACPSCKVTVRDMHEPGAAERARELGIRSLPAVVIDGILADCCAGRGPDEATLRRAGLGEPRS